MANKSTQIESEKAKLNINKSYIPYKNTKKNQNKVKSYVKNVNIFVALLIFIIMLAVGVGAYFIVSRNDCFELIGAQEIFIELKENEDKSDFTTTFFEDGGVKIIEFGKDISNNVKIETNMKKAGDNKYEVDKLGTYYIKYSIDSIKYGKIFTIEKIRLINFVEPSEDIGVN